MAHIGRVTVNWTGFAGAPGYTNLYWGEALGEMTQAIADGAAAKVDTWLGSMVALLPTTVSVQVDPSIDVIDDATGDLVSYYQTANLPIRVGNNTGNYSAASGACINWMTNGIKNARRVRGRTFLVPIGGESLGANGSIDDAKLSLLRTATGNMIAPGGTGQLGVWSRPTKAAPSSGQWFTVSAFNVNDKVAVLTSRRD
jgi:hypothetical protein